MLWSPEKLISRSARPRVHFKWPITSLESANPTPPNRKSITRSVWDPSIQNFETCVVPTRKFSDSLLALWI
jgi:hypothetical protein